MGQVIEKDVVASNPSPQIQELQNAAEQASVCVQVNQQIEAEVGRCYPVFQRAVAEFENADKLLKEAILPVNNGTLDKSDPTNPRNLYTKLNGAKKTSEKLSKRASECRMGDDGEWYTAEEFKEFYPRDWEDRFARAPWYLERRKVPSTKPKNNNQWENSNNDWNNTHNDQAWEEEAVYEFPEDFFRRHGGNGKAWTKNSKPGWDDAEKEQRKAEDGKWYVIREFKEFYPREWAKKWELSTDGKNNSLEWSPRFKKDKQKLDESYARVKDLTLQIQMGEEKQQSCIQGCVKEAEKAWHSLNNGVKSFPDIARANYGGMVEHVNQQQTQNMPRVQMPQGINVTDWFARSAGEIHNSLALARNMERSVNQVHSAAQGTIKSAKDQMNQIREEEKQEKKLIFARLRAEVGM